MRACVRLLPPPSLIFHIIDAGLRVSATGGSEASISGGHSDLSSVCIVTAIPRRSSLCFTSRQYCRYSSASWLKNVETNKKNLTDTIAYQLKIFQLQILLLTTLLYYLSNLIFIKLKNFFVIITIVTNIKRVTSEWLKETYEWSEISEAVSVKFDIFVRALFDSLPGIFDAELGLRCDLWLRHVGADTARLESAERRPLAVPERGVGCWDIIGCGKLNWEP